MLKTSIFFICGFLAVNAPSFSQDAEISLNINIEIEIEEEENDQYSFVLNNKTTVTKISEKQSEGENFFIRENFFNETKSIKVKSKTETSYKRDIPFIIPERDDIFISGGKLYYFGLPSNFKKDDSFTYEYEQEFSDITFLPCIWIENGRKYESLTITLYHPDDVKPLFNMYGVYKNYPFEVKYEDTDETTFQLNNIEPSEQIEYFPFNNYLFCVFISLVKNGININNTTPYEFVKWYSSLTSLKPELDQNDKQLLAKEIDSCLTPFEKIRVIHDFVRKNFRYIAEEQGENSIIPRKPSIVLNRRYADCKERASLVSAIAHEHGIDVNMALVTTLNSVHNDFAYVDKFDHVICAYDSVDNTLFFDPTAKYCEFNNLPEDDIGRYALILDLAKPKFDLIESPIQKASLSITIYTSIDSLNKAKATITLHNDYCASAKHALNELTGAKLENFMSAIILSNLFKISIDYFTKQSETENSLTFVGDADLSEFIISSISKKYIPKIPFLLLNRDIIDRANDSLGLYLPFRNSIQLNIIINAKNFILDPDSLYITDNDHLTEFRASAVESENGMLLLSYSLKLKEKEFFSTQKSEFIKFYDSYLLNKPNMFILKVKE